MVQRGNVVLVDLNPVIGSEQRGIRPAIIVQTDRANKVSPHTIIVPLTTKVREKRLPSHVFLPNGTGGLKEDSVALCEQIRVIDKQRILNDIGQLDEPFLSEPATALRIILAI